MTLLLLFGITLGLTILFARTVAHRRATLGALIWLAATGALGASGVLADWSRLPPPFFFFLIPTFVAATWLALSRHARPLILRMGWGTLIGYQVFRVFVELMLWQGLRDGLFPIQMTFEGRNFDILTGLSAPLVAWLMVRKPNPLLARAWNLMGLALLVNIVTVAILSTPTPLRVFMNEPANRLVAGFPFIWLPGVHVLMAWLGHIAVFVKLAEGRRASVGG